MKKSCKIVLVKIIFSLFTSLNDDKTACYKYILPSFPNLSNWFLKKFENFNKILV